MNLDPLHNAATEMMSLVSGAAGILPDLSADDGTGLLMPALTGVVAAVRPWRWRSRSTSRPAIAATAT